MPSGRPPVLASTTVPSALTRTTSPLERPVTTDPARSISTSSAPVPGSSTTDTGSAIGVPGRVGGGRQRAGRGGDMEAVYLLPVMSATAAEPEPLSIFASVSNT
jgi:hypothetical protein